MNAEALAVYSACGLFARGSNARQTRRRWNLLSWQIRKFLVSVDWLKVLFLNLMY